MKRGKGRRTSLSFVEGYMSVEVDEPSEGVYDESCRVVEDVLVCRGHVS